MTIVVLIVAVFLLAYSNGANDNFKGVATLYGSGTVSYRTARWKTIAQILATWMTTLPLGAALGAAIYWILTRVGS